jgi:hypothetical protein
MTVEALATLAHECGHLLSGACPQRSPHLQVRHGKIRCCLACEVRASEIAQQLIPFRPEMIDDLERALHTYRGMPASRRASRAASRFAGRARQALHWRVDLELKLSEIRRLSHEARHGLSSL